jgi:Molecular chaperone GrpE (heat shock protein)
MQDSNPDFESGVITEELQRGYKLKERVLRPAMVKVNE